MSSITQGNVNDQDIRRTFELFFQPGAALEMRIPKAGKLKSVSGYFNNPDDLLQAAAQYNGKVAGIYLTLNPVNPALMARASNKAVACAQQTTSDADVLLRRWLPFDFDPVRPSGISSTNEEKKAAKEAARAVRDFLRAEGWPDPVVGDSGNGWHLLYRVELPNDERALNIVRGCINAVAFRFADSKVSIDQSVYNAARIWKLYGTISRKGDNTTDRPHRPARLVEVPNPLMVVPEEKLLELAAMVPEEPKEQYGYRGSSDFDLDKWIEEHSLPVKREKTWSGGGRVWILNPCPWNPDHTDDSAYIVQFSSGAIAAGCHHNGCQGKDWHALRDLYDPGWRNKQKRHAEEKQPPKPVYTSLANVTPEQVNWLWEPYLPVGKLVIIEGDPEAGKTWVALAICSKLTRQGKTVLYATAEDGIADTIRNRVAGMNADLTKFYVLQGQKNGGNELLPVSLDDPIVLETAIQELKPALVVLDPVQAFLGAGVDMHKANQVRSRLAILTRLSETYKCTILVLRHLTKTAMDRAIYRGLGSIDFTAAARSVLLVGKTQDGTRALVQIKNSLAEYGQALGFEIRQGQFFWIGEVDISAEDLLRPETEQEEKTALEEAVEWLQSVLADGPIEARTILKEARQAGIAERTLHRAKTALKVASQKMGSNWVWKLATEERFSYCTNVGNLGNVDFSPTAARDSGNDSRLPIGNLEIQPSSPTAARPEGKIANIAKDNILNKKDIGNVQIRKVMGADELRRIFNQAID